MYTILLRGLTQRAKYATAQYREVGGLLRFIRMSLYGLLLYTLLEVSGANKRNQ